MPDQMCCQRLLHRAGLRHGGGRVLPALLQLHAQPSIWCDKLQETGNLWIDHHANQNWFVLFILFILPFLIYLYLSSLSIYLFICLIVYLFIYLFIHSFIQSLFINLFLFIVFIDCFYLFIYLFQSSIHSFIIYSVNLHLFISQ